MMKNIFQLKIRNVRIIILLQMEKNVINAIIRMLECLDVKVNVISLWREII